MLSAYGIHEPLGLGCGGCGGMPGSRAGGSPTQSARSIVITASEPTCSSSRGSSFGMLRRGGRHEGAVMEESSAALICCAC